MLFKKKILGKGVIQTAVKKEIRSCERIERVVGKSGEAHFVVVLR